MDIKVIRELWDLGMIDGFTRAEHEFKEIGIKPSHEKKMKLAEILNKDKIENMRLKRFI